MQPRSASRRRHVGPPGAHQPATSSMPCPGVVRPEVVERQDLQVAAPQQAWRSRARAGRRRARPQPQRDRQAGVVARPAPTPASPTPERRAGPASRSRRRRATTASPSTARPSASSTPVARPPSSADPATVGVADDVDATTPRRGRRRPPSHDGRPRRVSVTTSASGAAASSARSSGPSSSSAGRSSGHADAGERVGGVVPAPAGVLRGVAGRGDHPVDRARATDAPARARTARGTAGPARPSRRRSSRPATARPGTAGPASTSVDRRDRPRPAGRRRRTRRCRPRRPPTRGHSRAVASGQAGEVGGVVVAQQPPAAGAHEHQLGDRGVRREQLEVADGAAPAGRCAARR